jgi:hypothetical protein
MEQMSRRDAISGMIGLAGVVMLGDSVKAEERKIYHSTFNSNEHPFSADGLKVAYEPEKGGNSFSVRHCTKKSEKTLLDYTPSIGLGNGIDDYVVRASDGDNTNYGKMILVFEKGTRHGSFDVKSDKERVRLDIWGGSMNIKKVGSWPQITVEKYGGIQTGNLCVFARERNGQPDMTEIGIDVDFQKDGKKGATGLLVNFLGIPYSFYFYNNGNMKAIKRNFPPGESPKFLRKYALPFDQ